MREDNSEYYLNTLMDRHQRELERREKDKNKGRPKTRKRKQGGGRPSIPPEQHRISLSISLPMDAMNAVEQERRRCSGLSARRQTYPKSRVIEALVRQVLMNDERAAIAAQAAQLAAELKEFYEIARDAKTAWGRSTNGLPAPVDRVMERLTKRFNAMQKAQGAEPEPMPWEEQDSTDYVL